MAAAPVDAGTMRWVPGRPVEPNRPAGRGVPPTIVHSA